MRRYDLEDADDDMCTAITDAVYAALKAEEAQA